MKRFIGGIQITALLFGGAVFCWGAKKYCFSLLQAHCFSFQLDALFCDEQRRKIKDFFQSDDSFKTLPLHELSVRAREKFPSIQSLVLSLSAAGMVTARIKSVSPLFRINDNLVLVDGSKIFKSAIFSDMFLDHLNQVYLSQSGGFDLLQEECVGRLPKSFFATMGKLSVSLFDEYRISYQDKATWWLQDKQQKKFFILFNNTQMPNEHLLAICNKIKGTLVARGQFCSGRTQRWVADTRFKDQIILFRKTGGV